MVRVPAVDSLGLRLRASCLHQAPIRLYLNAPSARAFTPWPEGEQQHCANASESSSASSKSRHGAPSACPSSYSITAGAVGGSVRVRVERKARMVVLTGVEFVSEEQGESSFHEAAECHGYGLVGWEVCMTRFNLVERRRE